jgi:hypothetical protein
MESMWHYVKNGTEKVGPVPESELKSLASSGQVHPTDLVWSEGMTDWQPYNAVPALGGGAAGTPVAAPAALGGAAAFGAPVGAIGGYGVPPGLGGWLQFVGIIHIIYGALTCVGGVFSFFTIILPLVYIPMGIIFILIGAACLGARTALAGIVQVDAATELFLVKIRKYMMLYGVLFIIGMVIMVLAIIAIIVMVAVMGMSMENLMPAGMP